MTGNCRSLSDRLTVEAHCGEAAAGGPCGRRQGHEGHHATIAAHHLDEIARLRDLLELRAQDGMGPVQRGAWDDLKADRDGLRAALVKLSGLCIADAEALDRGFLHYAGEFEDALHSRANLARRVLDECGVPHPPSPYKTAGASDETLAPEESR